MGVDGAAQTRLSQSASQTGLKAGRLFERGD